MAAEPAEPALPPASLLARAVGFFSGTVGLGNIAGVGAAIAMGGPGATFWMIVAGLLGIFLGTFGAGRFYLNQPGIAVAQLAVSIVTCGLGGIWGLIDGIMMLTGNVKDQYGRPLRD